MCYASSAKEYRKQMGGSPDAASLPAPTDEGVKRWENAAKAFDQMVDDIASALRDAEAAHTGAAADAAKSSIAEIQPLARAAAETSRGVKAALEEQNSYQREAFQALPMKDDPLPSGQGALLDPPEKGWVEDWGLDSNPVTGWMSDYEERQQAYVDTNQQANQVMERYSQQTEGVIARLPEFQPADQPPPAAPPAASYPTASTYSAGDGGSSHSGGGYSAPASTSSAWASAPAAAPAHAPSAPPAASNPSWATPSGPGLPPGVVRGPDGTLFRQNPQTGAWERQNPYNGRWAPSPNGGPRGGRSGEGASAPVGRGAGGRAGMGGLGGSSAGSGAGGAAGGRPGQNGAPGGAGAGRGKQGEDDEQEHQRPGWLVEQDDVFTNDMQRTAPAVFGDADAGR
ncbi:hypothetical protein QFW96_07205 [Saccharopolyspora sp. TS4A08]|uniref:PPE domain-containing protein n=1 Tax=Saccharopolyspora ipomoeae TaxID=3042027 RepID=A0ABT6PLM1_9PSEU|nr:hypothetical protein [Saccharopolyspora sp. TS4A08]MDI2028391.1 hypothetical protein [Saccharopolyspora sp. TS4A08]